MRKVLPTNPAWLRAGVGSGDAASLVGAAVDANDNPLTLWAYIVSMTELKEIRKRMKKVRHQQGSTNWLDWRKLGVGGSEVACVVGANPYKGSKATDVWARKLPADHPDAQGEVADNSFMAHGRKYEPDARRIYESLMGWTAEDVCVLHPEHDFIRCSLDGLRPDDKVVWEAKCPGEKNHAKYIGISRILDPFERQTAFASTFSSYRYQALYQLAITNANVCHFCSYRPDWPVESDRFVLIPLYQEPDEQHFLIERVVEFWKFVTDRTAPPANWLEPCWRMPTAIEVRDE